MLGNETKVVLDEGGNGVVGVVVALLEAELNINVGVGLGGLDEVLREKLGRVELVIKTLVGKDGELGAIV